MDTLTQFRPDGVVKSDPPLFSIVVPTFNRDRTILTTLESVRSQDFRDFETIVVDDGSTDRTIEIMQCLDWVLLVQQKNLGPGRARNLGAKLARGTYLVFLDSDDVLFPWSLRTISATISLYNRPSAIAAAMVEFSDDSELERIEQRPLKRFERMTFFRLNPGMTALWARE
jgi:glycosyltransferase involved in cell wall biosynthesis